MGRSTQIQELTIAQGQIIPRGQIQVIQHLEGGIVAEIYVQEGTTVTAQQPLIRLRPEAAISERSQFEARRAALKLQLTRLEAESRNELPDFGDLGRQFPDLAAEQEKLNVSDVIQRREEHAALSAKVAQKRDEIATLVADLETARTELTLKRELLSIQDRLQTLGDGAREKWLQAKSQAQHAEGEVLNLENKLTTARSALQEAESSLTEADAKANQKLSEMRVKAASDLAETEQQLIKLVDRFDRLLIRPLLMELSRS